MTWNKDKTYVKLFGQIFKQAGAELGQAQLKLRLDFSLIKIYYMKNLKN